MQNKAKFPSLRQQIEFEEFDYQMLTGSLRDYARVRDKISDLLATGVIIRIKKGLYVFGNDYRRRPIARELLANLIYGPSYLSLEYALHYHGVTPERVEVLTSVTTGRSRSFQTPLGLFAYRQVPMPAFQIGMDRVELDDGRSFLIATPEKALSDKIVSERGLVFRSSSQLREYLLTDLRVDAEFLRELNLGRLDEIANRYRSRRIRLLAKIVRAEQ